jgi:hypothetical protein
LCKDPAEKSSEEGKADENNDGNSGLILGYMLK